MSEMNIINAILRTKQGSIQIRYKINIEFLSPHNATSSSSDYIASVGDCLHNTFATILHVWNPVFHRPPEDATCLGDKGNNTNNLKTLDQSRTIMACILEVPGSNPGRGRDYCEDLLGFPQIHQENAEIYQIKPFRALRL